MNPITIILVLCGMMAVMAVLNFKLRKENAVLNSNVRKLQTDLLARNEDFVTMNKKIRELYLELEKHKPVQDPETGKFVSKNHVPA